MQSDSRRHRDYKQLAALKANDMCFLKYCLLRDEEEVERRAVCSTSLWDVDLV